MVARQEVEQSELLLGFQPNGNGARRAVKEMWHHERMRAAKREDELRIHPLVPIGKVYAGGRARGRPIDHPLHPPQLKRVPGDNLF